MNKGTPELVIMAAGMGSRYGGLKQIDPMDDEGHIIIDFSLYDAYRAGFRTVNFIIKPELEADFRERIGDRVSQFMTVRYIYQTLDKIPEDAVIPEGRVKPWGTGHAILCAADAVKNNFAVINADDYYGRNAFGRMFELLSEMEDGDKASYAMLGYRLKNTVSEAGRVARGICEIEDGKLVKITERTAIETFEGGIRFTEDGGESYTELDGDTIVSMNFWGFTPSIFKRLESSFDTFIREATKTNPLKCELYLPFVVDEMLAEGRAEVTVLESEDRWYGVTYADDKPAVKAAFTEMKKRGDYPSVLLGK